MNDLLVYCQTAIRLGSSRGMAFEQWRKHHPETSRRLFERVWRSARAAEQLFTEYGGIRR